MEAGDALEHVCCYLVICYVVICFLLVGYALSSMAKCAYGEVQCVCVCVRRFWKLHMHRGHCHCLCGSHHIWQSLHWCLLSSSLKLQCACGGRLLYLCTTVLSVAAICVLLGKGGLVWGTFTVCMAAVTSGQQPSRACHFGLVHWSLCM